MFRNRLQPEQLFSPRLVVAILCLLGFAAQPATAGKYKNLTGAKWRTNQPYADVQVSNDQRTLTTRLPPASTITNTFSGRNAGVELQFGSGDQFHPSAGADVSPSSAAVQCYYSVSNAFALACSADATWLRTLTQETSVQLRVKGFGTTTPQLTWILQPASDEVFVSKIEGPGTAVKTQPYEFTLRLTEPAPSGGLEVMWRLDPAGCFAALPGGESYSPSGALNTLTVPEGVQYKAVAVAVQGGCSASAANIRTWVHQQVDRAPNYLTRRIGLAEPPRRR